MGKVTPDVPADKLALYERVVATRPDVKRKGAKNPYTSLNGHMFSFIDKTGAMSLRLPKDAREKFITDFNTELSVQYGAVMKEYVIIPDALLADTEQLSRYFNDSYNYIASLKPKPTKRKPKA